MEGVATYRPSPNLAGEAVPQQVLGAMSWLVHKTKHPLQAGRLGSGVLIWPQLQKANR